MRVLKVSRKKVNVEGVYFSPDGRLLIVCAEEVEVGPWDVQTGLPDASGPKPDLQTGMPAAFHPSGRWLFGTGGNYGLVAHDLTEHVSHRWPSEPDERVIYPRFTPDGTTLLHGLYRPQRGAPWERKLVCRSWAAGAPADSIWTTRPCPDRPDGFLTGVALLDAERFATADYEFGARARITVRSLRTGEILATRGVHSSDYIDLAASPDGTRLVVRKGPHLLAWESSDISVPGRGVAHNGRKHFTDLAFHPSGRYLAATSNDTTVKLYDTATWEVARTLTWELGRMRSICFSPDGTLAAAGSDTGHVVVWDVDV